MLIRMRPIVVAVVHNGIIENFRELREQLIKKGCKFVSETDTEAVAHLVSLEIKNGKSPADAVAAALKQLRGAFALGVPVHRKRRSADRRAQRIAARHRVRQR